jgi:hypothetical protein
MLMRRHPLLLLALLGACDSKVTSTVDADLQARVETVQDCFPGLYSRAQALLDVAETWRLNNGTAIADPAGLSWSEQGDGSVQVTYAVGGGTTIAMTVRFYSPTGVQQDLALGTPATFNDLMDVAATELRNTFGATPTFMVGDWTISGGGITGSGALTGIISGSGSSSELLELRTTTATPAGGPPPVATSSVTDNGPPVCTFAFTIPQLETDGQPNQQYPIGTVSITLTGPEAVVDGVITFDGTSTANIAITDIPGSFDFDVEARSLVYVP